MSELADRLEDPKLMALAVRVFKRLVLLIEKDGGIPEEHLISRLYSNEQPHADAATKEDAAKFARDVVEIAVGADFFRREGGVIVLGSKRHRLVHGGKFFAPDNERGKGPV